MSHHWTPSIVPNGSDETVYLVVDCFGKGGCVFREAEVGATDLETVIAYLMSPLLASCGVADLAYEDLSSSIESFVVHHAGRERQLNLRLA